MGQVAEAGTKGADGRSDCWVGVETASSGGVQIDVRSNVQVMYGDSIRGLVAKVLKDLGVAHAEVSVVDHGALPFVLAARVEAAVKRALPETRAESVPEMAHHAAYASTRERFRRSRLYLPGNDPKFMLNAGLHQADGLILDLEDSVAPAEKDAARILVRNALRRINFCGAERMVRINQLPKGLEDLEYVVPHNVHLLLVPKCESAEQVREVEKAVQAIRKRSDVRGEIFLMPIIESALGAIKAYEIAAASKSIVAMAIGLEDYTADIGVQRTREDRESFWARCQVVNASRAARIQPIDTVFSDVADMDGLRSSVLEAKSMGFDGKGCIHPRQIRVINEAFAPADAEIDKAKKIVLAFERAQARGLSVVSLGSKMIDPPVLKCALRTVDLAIATQKITKDWRKDCEL